ncbi:MAG: aryl-sulfate sulfotransferase [Myxococcales bacterium]|nr:aryl-sulfate sulfotransferase [Myxococcales bacterium]
MWAWLALGCAPEVETLFVEPPRVWMNDFFAAPLAGQLLARSVEDVALQVDIVSPHATQRLTGPLGTEHAIDLWGFRAGADHRIEVTVRTETDELLWPQVSTVTTEPLPPDFPRLEVLHTTDRRTPGLDLFHVDAEPDDRPEYIVVLDGRGDVVWYFAARSAVNHVVQLSSGDLVYMPDRYWMEQIDLFGRSVRSYRSRITPTADPMDLPVDHTAFHHDVVELPSGNLLALGIELVDQPAYPDSEEVPGQTAPARVAYDTLVEVDDAGTVVNEIGLVDVLDPLRVGRDAVQGTWWTSFAGTEIRDWGHANSVAYDADSSSVLVSLRHQDAVAKLSYPTGELDWILAPSANWTEPLVDRVLRPAGATRLPYHQHHATWTSADTVLMFDNGNHQASAFEPPVGGGAIDSRAVEFRIDAARGTFTQIWGFDDLPESNFSPGLGGAQALPTGHVWITYGAAGGGSAYDARLLEVDRITSEVVHDVALLRGEGRIYRAVRVDGLGPSAAAAP